MPLFRCKPVEIIAMQFTGDNLPALREYFNTEEIYETASSHPDYIYIVTLKEQRIRVGVGQWIIWANKPGRFYRCDPDVFAERYEQVEE